MKGPLENTISQEKLSGKRHLEGQQNSGWMIVKEWTGLSSNEMWREPEDRVAWRKFVSRVAINGLNSLRNQDNNVEISLFLRCMCM